MILCDTNIFINLFKGKAEVKATLDKIGNENIAFSIITFGAFKSLDLKALVVRSVLVK